MQSLFMILAFFLSLSIVSCEGGGRSNNNNRKGSSGDDPRVSKQRVSRFTSPNFCPEAGLSAEQKEQIKNLFQERGNQQSLSREERRTAQEELQKKILEEVVKTEEAKTALSKCFEQRGEHRKRSSSQGSAGDLEAIR